MPKAEKGSIKDIGKRIKAKGLQRLRFYCQMCEKQCRDANGFKCHLTSESHLRQMKVFSENAKGYMNQYSREFEKIFLDTLRTRHTTATVNANNVYQEVIQDKQHVHMNATIWASLTDFVKYLGRKGLAKVEETERGWFISYIERDMAKQQREETLQKRKQAEAEAEAAMALQMEQQRIAAAKELDKLGASISTEGTKMEQRREEDGPLQVALPKSSDAVQKKAPKKRNLTNAFGDDDDEEEDDKAESKKQKQNALPAPPVAQKIESRKKPDKKATTITPPPPQPPSTWLHKNIIVRVVTKSLPDYFRKKAVVDKLVGDHVAEVCMLDTSDVLQIDQDDLDTVIPKVGQKARIVRGEHRGRRATVVELDSRQCRGLLRLSSSLSQRNNNGDRKKTVELDYADFSKLA